MRTLAIAAFLALSLAAFGQDAIPKCSDPKAKVGGFCSTDPPTLQPARTLQFNDCHVASMSGGLYQYFSEEYDCAEGRIAVTSEPVKKHECNDGWRLDPISHAVAIGPIPQEFAEEMRRNATTEPEAVDVPAVQESYVAYLSESNCPAVSTAACVRLGLRWTCADKSRILQTSEDGTHWCHKPQTSPALLP